MIYLFRLFVDLNKLSDSIKTDLENDNVNLYSYDSFYEQLKKDVQFQDKSHKFCVIFHFINKKKQTENKYLGIIIM